MNRWKEALTLLTYKVILYLSIIYIYKGNCGYEWNSEPGIGFTKSDRKRYIDRERVSKFKEVCKRNC